MDNSWKRRFSKTGKKQSISFLRFLQKIEINPKTSMTKTPGLFAAGDVDCVPYKQIVIACGEGAKASLSAYDYLQK